MSSRTTRHFTLLLTGVEDLTREVVDALYEAGCDDGLVGRQFGRTFITFSREAPTLKDAILSAIRDVKAAGLGVLRVDTRDVVTQSDIGRKIGRSRQLVGKYVPGQRGPGHFPPPLARDIQGEDPLWSWCEVAAWLHENGFIGEEDLRDAQHVAAIKEK